MTEDESKIGTTISIHVRLVPDEIERLDEWVAELDARSRPHAIRKMLAPMLKKKRNK